MADIFAGLSGGEQFGKIDLSQTNSQIEAEDYSKVYLTLNISKGMHQYNRLVFGIASIPAT